MIIHNSIECLRLSYITNIFLNNITKIFLKRVGNKNYLYNFQLCRKVSINEHVIRSTQKGALRLERLLLDCHLSTQDLKQKHVLLKAKLKCIEYNIAETVLRVVISHFNLYLLNYINIYKLYRKKKKQN